MWNKRRWTRLGAALLCAGLMPGQTMQVFAQSPEFARTAEEWETLRDDRLDYNEIPDLVHEYNNTVIQNQIAYRDERDQDRDDVAQDYYDRANEIYNNLEYPDTDDASYGSRMAAALSSEQQAQSLMEQGDESVEDSETIKLGYDKTEAELVKQAQSLMITYWSQYYSLDISRSAGSQAEASYQTAQNRLAAGMNTQSDVLTAKEAVSNAEASLLSAESSFNTTKENLCQMLGWSYGAQVEIGELPEPDGEAIAAIDLQADIARALENSYSYQITAKQLANARTASGKEKLAQTQKNQKEAISNDVGDKYQSLTLAKSSYDQAVQAYELEQASLASAERKLAAGTITQKAYSEQQASCGNARVAVQTKKLALLQAQVDYDWAVNGLASVS